MHDPAQTTDDEVPVDDVARAIANGVAGRHGLPLWDDCPEEIRDIWRRTVKELREIQKDMNYDWFAVPNYWRQKGLSMRSANALANGGINDIDDLKRMTPKELLALPNLGPVSLREVQNLLEPSVTK